MLNHSYSLSQFSKKNNKRYGLWVTFAALRQMIQGKFTHLISLLKKKTKRQKSRAKDNSQNQVRDVTEPTNKSTDQNVITLEDGTIKIGKLTVTQRILGYGSHGTIVFRGSMDKRPAAIKRVLSAFYCLAEREISLLLDSDGHTNVLRYYAKEQHGEFVYLALELCSMTLADIIEGCNSGESVKERLEQDDIHDSSESLQEDNQELEDLQKLSKESSTKKDRVRKSKKVLDFVQRIRCNTNGDVIKIENHTVNTCAGVRRCGRVEEWLVNLLQGMMLGLAHIHLLGIVHCDLKPHNVLVTRQGITKISDMGLSRRLEQDRSSFGRGTTSSSSIIRTGSVGWQAPELLCGSPSNQISLSNSAHSSHENETEFDHGESKDTNESHTAITSDSKSTEKTRKTRAVDIFSAGCIIHYCLTDGDHPFCDWYQREANIRNPSFQPNLLSLELLPEAQDLVACMIKREASLRPTAEEVLQHPFFWNDDKKYVNSSSSFF